MASWVLLWLACSWISSAAPQQAPSNSLSYKCNATGIHLAMKSNPLGTGALLLPKYLTLGWCNYSTITDVSGYIVFEYRLTDCGFSRLTSGMMVEYFADLAYNPTAGTSRTFNTAFVERINCTSYSPVSIQAPSYPVVTQLSSSGVLTFQANLMNADFSSPSGTNVYALGSNINIELSVQSAFHLPMQIYVDECTAALTPMLETAAVKYSVIHNHGCFVDGKVADSMFVARPSALRIRLTLQAFRFAADASNVYLHFKLLVWDPNLLTDSTRKACSYYRNTGSWKLLDDPSSSICACCDSVCPSQGSSRFGRALQGSEASLAHTVRIDPLLVQISDPRTGSYEWHVNSSLAVEMPKEYRHTTLPPAVGALLMELALLGLLALGVHLYNRPWRTSAVVAEVAVEIENTRLVLEDEQPDA